MVMENDKDTFIDNLIKDSRNDLVEYINNNHNVLSVESDMPATIKFGDEKEITAADLVASLKNMAPGELPKETIKILRNKKKISKAISETKITNEHEEIQQFCDQSMDAVFDFPPYKKVVANRTNKVKFFEWNQKKFTWYYRIWLYFYIKTTDLFSTELVKIKTKLELKSDFFLKKMISNLLSEKIYQRFKILISNNINQNNK